MTTGNNDFLPIATAGGAPVLSQSSWAAAVPANGRGAGIFPKEWYNKATRQSSVMAAALGGLVANAGFNANDDGNIAALTLAIQNAISKLNTPTHYSLYTANGASISRSVYLLAGTWQVALIPSVAAIEDTGAIGGGTYNLTATQSGSLGSATVNASIQFKKEGGGGYGRCIYGAPVAVNTLVVTTPGFFTMQMSAISLAGALTAEGSMMEVEKIA